MTSDEIDLKQAAAVLRRMTTSITTHPNLGRGGEMSLSQIFDILVSGAEELGFNQCALFLYEEGEEALVLKASRGLPAEWKERRLRPWEGNAGIAFAEKREHVVSDRESGEGGFEDAYGRVGSVMSIPIRVGEDVIGAVNYCTREPHEYSEQEVDLLVSITNCAATAIARVDKNEKLKNREVERLYTYYRALELKSDYHKGHVDRVLKYVRKTGLQMGLSDAAMKDLMAASRIHDVGKVGIKDSILDSTGDLSPEQFEEIKRHPRAGADFIRETSPDISQNIIDGVEYHHECFNGTGYPDGLAGERIPLIARIIAVADGFDAMTSERPYKDPMPVLVALEELKRCSGMEYNDKLLILYRVLEMIKRDENVPEVVRLSLSISYETVEDIYKCAEMEHVKPLIPRCNEIITKEGARHNPTVSKTIYDPRVTQAFLETQPGRYGGI